MTRYHDQRRLTEGRYYFGLWFYKDKNHSWWRVMTAGRRHSGRGRKLKDCIFNHRQQTQRVNWKWGYCYKSSVHASSDIPSIHSFKAVPPFSNNITNWEPKYLSLYRTFLNQTTICRHTSLLDSFILHLWACDCRFLQRQWSCEFSYLERAE